MQRHVFLNAQPWLTAVDDSRLLRLLDDTPPSLSNGSDEVEVTKLFRGIGLLYTNAGRLAITPASKEQFLYFSTHVNGCNDAKDPTELDLELVIGKVVNETNLYVCFDGKWYIVDHFQIQKICKRLDPKDNKPPYCEFEFAFVGLRFFQRDSQLQETQKTIRNVIKEMLCRLKTKEEKKASTSNKRRKLGTFVQLFNNKSKDDISKEPTEAEVEKVKEELYVAYSNQVSFLSTASKLSSPLINQTSLSGDILGDQLNNLAVQYSSSIVKPQDYNRMQDTLKSRLAAAESFLESKFNETFVNDDSSDKTKNKNNNNSSKEFDLKREISFFEFKEAKQLVLDALEMNLVFDLLQ